MEFEDALRALKEGMIVTNENWNSKNMCLFMVEGKVDSDGVHCSPFIMMSDAEGFLIPWLASQIDLFSDGWINTGPY